MSEFDYVKTRREDVRPIDNQRFARRLIRWYTRFNIRVFKLSKGRLMKHWPGGYPICVVGMTGRKSGQRREVALIYLPYRDGVLLVASQGGMDTDPVWYQNIMANPNIDVLVDGQRRNLVARRASDEEKRELWPVLLGMYPDFDEYQARTDRNIPVLICTPKSAA